ncbi:hypothetical protein GDO78_017432 [Eleutherodactylus coqui]|uniref:Uncharacterized protein n=1 Tax=Eleutherodactylus coqui TaxID=57060 RepID=A0A8J6BA37_ELECQ|nr:hypothetical protein GDO78_017432 [Eleutherodactylus coqui]
MRTTRLQSSAYVRSLEMFVRRCNYRLIKMSVTAKRPAQIGVQTLSSSYLATFRTLCIGLCLWISMKTLMALHESSDHYL